MNRIDRLQAILITLQSKRVVRAEELSNRFGVSHRTIYRDIRALEEGGVPIGSEAGIGYFLSDGYHIPPVMFTHDEARALLLAGKMVEQMTDSTVSSHYQNALTKVRAVLDMDKKDELESLDRDIIINPFPNEPQMHGSLDMDKIKHALSISRTLNLVYNARGSGEQTTREVEPIGLCFYYGAWHLIAFCRLRQDYRDFRLDRIEKLELTDQRYQRHKHPRLRAYIDSLIEGTELDIGIIRVRKPIHKYLENTKFQIGLVFEEEKGEWVEMHFAVFHIDYLARWILSICSGVEIVEPESLKARIIELTKDLADEYLK